MGCTFQLIKPEIIQAGFWQPQFPGYSMHLLKSTELSAQRQHTQYWSGRGKISITTLLQSRLGVFFCPLQFSGFITRPQDWWQFFFLSQTGKEWREITHSLWSLKQKGLFLPELCLFMYPDVFWIFQAESRQVLHRFSLCCWEKQCLAFLGKVFYDGIHRISKAHVQNPVSFIKYWNEKDQLEGIFKKIKSLHRQRTRLISTTVLGSSPHEMPICKSHPRKGTLLALTLMLSNTNTSHDLSWGGGGSWPKFH